MNFTNMNRRIRTIDQLDMTIRELRMKQKSLETTLDNNFQNLKGNYFSMTMKSVFGGKRSSTNFWADIVTRFMESEKLQEGVSNLVSKMADKVGDVLKGDKS
jgi:NAD-specific glutamate dehydrogenase